MKNVPSILSIKVRPGFTKNRVHTIITPVRFSPTFGKSLGTINAFLTKESVTVRVNSRFERVTSRAPPQPWWPRGTTASSRSGPPPISSSPASSSSPYRSPLGSK